MPRAMERLDALVAGLGVLVVATALAGVVTSGPGGGARDFTVAFVEQRVPLEAQRGAFTGDNAAEVDVRVGLLNVTRLTFTVRVTGAGPRASPDSVEVTLQGPDGRRETQRATLPGPGGAADATLTFERAVASAPQPIIVRGASEDEAVAGVPASYASNNATGTWSVAASARGQVGALHTEGHNVVVEAVAMAYRAVVQPEPVNPR